MGWAQPIFFSPANTTLRLGELLEMTIPPLGYELVDWEMSPKGRLVRVFIDKANGVNVEDCAKVSHHLTRLFTVENIDYDRLEVSSPGLDRPLTKLADYARFAGEDVQLNLHEMTDGARRWKGTLRGVEGDHVLVETATGIRTFPFAGIDRCRLVPKIEWRKGK
jgi:ribosome maturation factor RimP